MTTVPALQEAIDRSRIEIVHLYYVGGREDLLDELEEIYDGEIRDAVQLDGSVRVWGWSDQIAEGKMEWRLVVRLVG
jgi:hypothetical protein